MRVYIVILILLILLITACSSESSNNKKPELNSEIIFARDLNGKWSGPLKFEDNVANPACKYKGSMNLVLEQTKNKLEGAFYLIIDEVEKLKNIPCLPEGPSPPQQVDGAISSSQVNFKTSNKFIEFAGQIKKDLLTLDFESCPNQKCADGKKQIGSKGVAKLTRE